MTNKNLSFREKFTRWRKEQNLKGPEAMDRFVQLSFIDALGRVSDEFVLKGGNLVWYYIQTPRFTVDLDFSTQTLNSHLEVKTVIEKACKSLEGIEFFIDEFKEIDKSEIHGSSIKLSFKTEDGATNKFSIDIVYALATDLKKIKSPLEGREVHAASIENIISDKLDAIIRKQRFTTRAKDFDDLWRISKSGLKINSKKVRMLVKACGIENLVLDSSDISSVTKDSWRRHQKKYADLPKEIEVVINDISKWLLEIL